MQKNSKKKGVISIENRASVTSNSENVTGTENNTVHRVEERETTGKEKIVGKFELNYHTNLLGGFIQIAPGNVVDHKPKKHFIQIEHVDKFI